MALAVIVSGKSIIFDNENRFNNAKTNCFIRHLKNAKQLRENFEEFPSQTNFNFTECETFVESVQNFYYQRVKNGSTFSVEVPDFQELLEHQGDCVEKQLRQSYYGDLILKSFIYDALKPLTDDLSIERNQTVTKLQTALSTAISACTFTALYDEYIQIRRHNYCARKYVINNDIMGLRHFNLTLNPFHIDLSDVNCDELIQKMVDDITTADESTTIGASDALQLLSHEWGVIFLTEINVSNEQREIEKKKYQEDLKKITL